MGRHDYPGAIHLLHIRGRSGHTIFFPADALVDRRADARESSPDLQRWESLLARTCDRYGARVYAYSWLPNDAFLLLQRFAVPLRILVPSWLGQYARYLHKVGRVTAGQSPYLSRYHSIEVTPEAVPYAVRHVYWRAVRAGLCGSPSAYPLCSYPLHFAKSVPDWFSTDEFIARVARRGYVGEPLLRQFLAKPESRRHADLFEQLSSRTPQIAGESSDIEDSIQFAKYSPPAPSIEQVADAVETMLLRESLYLDRVLTAALTTWYATRSGAATLKQMGLRFDREPTTLRADIESRRKTSPALFELNVGDILRIGKSQGPDHVRTNTPTRRGGGSARVPSRAALAAACMISKEDAACQRELHDGGPAVGRGRIAP